MLRIWGSLKLKLRNLLRNWGKKLAEKTKFNKKLIPAALEVDGIGKELEANRTILDASSSSGVITNGSA
jgi:hypothetical protein